MQEWCFHAADKDKDEQINREELFTLLDAVYKMANILYEPNVNAVMRQADLVSLSNFVITAINRQNN